VASIGGNSVAENSYQVNGLNLTNFRNGIGSSFVPFEFMEEVQVKTGGYEAEFGRATGGVINMVTKSGSNSLRGGVNAYHNPSSLQEMKDDNYLYPNEAGESEELEANASIGGPIFKDKLFYFAFIDYTDRSDWWMTTARGNLNEQETPYYGGKLDWNITPNFRLEGTYFTDETTVDQTTFAFDEASYTFGDQIGVGTVDRGGENYIGKFTGILAENFLIAAQYGKNDFKPHRRLERRRLRCRLRRPRRRPDRGRPLGQFAGQRRHRLARGDPRRRRLVPRRPQPARRHRRRDQHLVRQHLLLGPRVLALLQQRQPLPELPEDTVVVRLRHLRVGRRYETLTNAIYAQDSWAVSPNFTINAGIRWEVFDNKNALGESYIKVDDQYAPRLGAIWDPSGKGRSKIYGSYGLYHLPIASNTNIRQAGMEFFDEIFYEVVWDGTGNPYDEFGLPLELGQSLSYTLISDGTVKDPRLTKSNSIDPSSQWEMILGYEQMVGSDWSVGARFINREFGKVIEDITIDQQLWLYYGVDCYNPNNHDPDTGFGTCEHEYRLTNPGEDFAGWYDVNGDGELDPISWTGEEGLYPEPERKYYAVELTAKAFRRKLDADGVLHLVAVLWQLRGLRQLRHRPGRRRHHPDL
jgi:hypothetical protein